MQSLFTAFAWEKLKAVCIHKCNHFWIQFWLATPRCIVGAPSFLIKQLLWLLCSEVFNSSSSSLILFLISCSSSSFLCSFSSLNCSSIYLSSSSKQTPIIPSAWISLNSFGHFNLSTGSSAAMQSKYKSSMNPHGWILCDHICTLASLLIECHNHLVCHLGMGKENTQLQGFFCIHLKSLQGQFDYPSFLCFTVIAKTLRL